MLNKLFYQQGLLGLVMAPSRLLSCFSLATWVAGVHDNIQKRWYKIALRGDAKAATLLLLIALRGDTNAWCLSHLILRCKLQGLWFFHFIVKHKPKSIPSQDWKVHYIDPISS